MPSEKKPRGLYRALMAATVWAAGPSVTAAPPDITPYVTAGVGHDDNLFRFENSQEALETIGTTDKSDTWYQAGAGVDVRWPISRQEFVFDLDVNRTAYDRFDDLDYTGGLASAQWRWRRGSLWSGRLGYDYRRSLSSFTERATITRDLKDTHRLFGDAERQVTTRWVVNAGAGYKDVDFSERDEIAREEVRGTLGAAYVSRKRNRIGVELSVTDAEFPNRDVDFVRGTDDGYQQTELNAVVRWQVQTHSRIEVRAGYTDREQDNISRDDFDGPTGRFTYFWSPGKKTTVSAFVWREVSALSDEIANFAKVNGIGTNIDWEITSKVKLDLGATWENRDFEGRSEEITVVLPNEREDDVAELQLGLEYLPRRNIIIRLGYNTGDRDSNRESLDYTFNEFTGSATLRF